MSDDSARQLGEFIDRSPTPHHVVANLVAELEDAGFDALGTSQDGSDDGPGRRYVRLDGSLIAWVDGAIPDAPMRIIAAHTDSPTLRIRPRPDVGSEGIAQLGVEIYGGPLLNSWLDRDLGIAGRVAVRDGDQVDAVTFRSEDPQLRVAQLAIHLDREIGERGLVLDRQQHITPIWALGSSRVDSFRCWLAAEIGRDASDVIGWDLSCFDFQRHSFIGRQGEFLCTARLDDLASCFTATRALVELGDDNPNPAVLILLDHEEVGSGTATGASSTHVERTLARRAQRLGISDQRWSESIASSCLLSADMAHATHPNYPERHEPAHHIAMGGGPAIKYNVNARYATDGTTAARFKIACESAGVPWQEYSHRGGMPCGSTIGPLLAAGLGVATVDVGAPQLSMHSIREMMAAKDVGHLLQSFRAWFGTTEPMG